MPRPTRSYGRPGTAAIPEDWGPSHAPVAESTQTASVSLRHDGTTTSWDDALQQTVTAQAAPYATAKSARIQAQRETAVDRPAESAEETLRVTGYLVTLPYAITGIRVGDLIDVTSCDDTLLTGHTLRVADMVRGSLRFERDVFCTLLDQTGGVPAWKIDTSELTGLAGDLAKTAGAVGARASAAVRKTAHDIEADAKGLAPVDTGFLKNSISTEITGDGRFSTITAEVGPTAEYGVFQELGTSRMAAQPYLAPAFDRRMPGFEQAMALVGGTLL